MKKKKVRKGRTKLKCFCCNNKQDYLWVVGVCDDCEVTFKKVKIMRLNKKLSEPVCQLCWKKGQIQKDCPHCKGTGKEYPKKVGRKKTK